MFTVPCSMGVYFCTLLTRRVRMESSGKLRPTLICLASVSQLHTYFWSRLNLVWFCSVLYEVFPMSFLMEQAGGQSFTGKERVGFLPLFIFFKNSRNNFVLCQPCAFSLPQNKLTHWHWQALDLVPTKIHERSPVFLGSYDDVEEIKALYAELAKTSSAWSGHHTRCKSTSGLAVTWFRHFLLLCRLKLVRSKIQYNSMEALNSFTSN